MTHIRFRNGIDCVDIVDHNGILLGHISWYGEWKCHVLESSYELEDNYRHDITGATITHWSANTLALILNKIKELDNEREQERKKR